MIALAPPVTLHVCVTCRRGEEPLEPRQGRSGHKMQAALAEAMQNAGAAGIELVPAECLSGCKRSCTVALASPGKWSYVIADLDPARHAADILAFAQGIRGASRGRARLARAARNREAERARPRPPTCAGAHGMIAPKVPVTIITGFLGAGKTTLIRHTLENAGGRRLALIINEFGDLGIDGTILKSCGIESCSEENIVELTNGCLCCTVADDFAPTLDALLSRENRPDHIIIETSGLALPKPLVKAFDWPGIRTRATVDGVVAVVDGPAVAAGRFATDLDALAKQRAADPSLDHDNPLEEVFEDQLMAADLVILNKADLLDAEALKAVEAQIVATLPRAVKLVHAQHGAIPVEVLLGLDAAAEDDLHARPSHHDNEAEHDHDDFESFIAEIPALSAPSILADRAARIAAEHDVLRVKGYADIEGKPMRLLVQGVGSRIETRYERPWKPGAPRRGELVVIGLKGIDRERVTQILRGEA